LSNLSLQGFVDECERECLHRAQAIQPYGVLLGGVAYDPCIRFVSANSEDWLGMTPQALFGRVPSDFIADFPPTTAPDEWAIFTGYDSVLPDVATWMQPGVKKYIFSALYTGQRGALDAQLSCSEENWLLEFEPSLPMTSRHEAYRPVPHRLYHPPANNHEWHKSCQFLADELRAVTGFERVMIYRFQSDGCGEVITESRLATLPPYLGLRYPASDIPQIARHLYQVNRHRQIPDSYAASVPIITEQDVSVDLTFSGLRAVSPVHVQYLQNMGVTASLSFSLLISGQLWGLIACHHRQAVCLSLPVRERCAEMARVFTLTIASYTNNQRLIEVTESDKAIKNLGIALQQAQWYTSFHHESYDSSLGRALLSLVAAEGAALIDIATQEIITFGITPDRDAIQAQIQWLREYTADPIFATDALPQLYPPAITWQSCASGLLAVRIHCFDADENASERLFLWWRPEQPQVVYWAGDPRKSALFDDQSQILSPRSSFEQWVETTSGHSEPWSDADLLRARKFRSLVLRDINFSILRN
jgi:light-regulated signal transduction histidine kinase (bacteriophytochrome)